MGKAKEMTKEQYLQKVNALMQDRCTEEAYNRTKIAEAYELYYGDYKNKSYQNLLEIHEGKENAGTTPYHEINWNSIASQINLLVGELNGRQFGLDVRAINEDAYDRKLVFERQLSFLAQMRPMLENAAQATGQDFGLNDKMPRNAEEIKAYMEEYRDVYEILIEESLRQLIEKTDYRYLRKEMFLDLLVTNQCHADPFLSNDDIEIKRCNPFNVIPDVLSSNDFLDDAYCFLYAEYMNPEKICEEFNLDKKDIEEIKKSRESEHGWRGVNGGSNGGLIWEPFQANGRGDDTGRMLVIKAMWLDTEEVAIKATVDQYDQLHVHEYFGTSAKNQRLSNKEKQAEEAVLEKKTRKIVRRATVIAGYYVTDYGICPDLIRDFNDPFNTSLTKQSLILNYNNKKSVGIIDRMAPIQHFKNYVLTLMQKELTTSIGSFVAIDVSLIDPEIYGHGDEVTDNLLHLLKAYKVVLYNSKKGEVPLAPGQKPIDVQDPRQSNIIDVALRVSAFCDAEMERITGVSEARQGMVGDQTLVRTGQMKINQSNLITENIFQGFFSFEKRLFKKIAALVAMSWAENPKKYMKLAAQMGVDIPENFEADIQSYDVFVETSAVTQSKVVEWVESAVMQSGPDALSNPDLLELVLDSSKNVNLAMRKFIANSRKREEAQMQIRERELQLEQKREQNKALEMQNNIKLKGQVDIEKEKVKAQLDRENKKMDIDQRDRSAVASQTMELIKMKGSASDK